MQYLVKHPSEAEVDMLEFFYTYGDRDNGLVMTGIGTYDPSNGMAYTPHCPVNDIMDMDIPWDAEQTALSRQNHALGKSREASLVFDSLLHI